MQPRFKHATRNRFTVTAETSASSRKTVLEAARTIRNSGWRGLTPRDTFSGMSAPPPTPLPPQPDPSEQFRQLLQFVRTENEAYRQASRQEAEAVRNVLSDSIKIVAYPVAVAGVFFTLLFGLAGWMGLRSWHDMKVAIRAQANQATQAEVKDMRQKIQRRLDDEFQDTKIRSTIQQAARDATTTVARPMIQGEVSRQVLIEQAVIRKSYSAQFENEFNRIRDFRAVVTVAIPPTLSDPGRFSQWGPTVYLKRGNDYISEFGAQQPSTEIASNTNAILEFVHQEDMFAPFKNALLNKRINSLDGINRLAINLTTDATKIDKLLEFLNGITSIDIQLVLNSVTLYQVHITQAQLKVSDEMRKSLASGSYTLEIPLDPSFFHNTEAEYKAANK